MNFKHKRKNRPNNLLIHKFDKIMYLSCVQLSNNRYELTYLLDYVFTLNETKSLIPIKVIITYEDFIKVIKCKFGVWLRFNNNYFRQNYLYIYRNLNNKRLIFKSTRHNNSLNNGFTNQYNHELIFKASLSSNALVEELR